LALTLARIGSTMRSTQDFDIAPVRFATDTNIVQPVMVSSHERSGTHFLINTIAQNSEFRNDPYLNYDATPLGSFHNFNDRTAVEQFFGRLKDSNCASLVKSHFAAPFFVDDGSQFLLKHLCKTIYILRDPVDVMLSYRRLIDFFAWHEGPRRRDVVEFLRSAPEGRMLRYQHGQIATIAERWKTHVSGWLDVAERNPAHVLVVNYHDLDRDHERETKRILTFLGCSIPEAIRRPDRVTRAIFVPSVPVSAAERERIRGAILELLGPVNLSETTFPDLFRKKMELLEA
jgi:hypothetical protein